MAQFKTDNRLVVYLSHNSVEDVLFRDRVTVASKTLGVSNSKLIREAIAYGLDNISEFRERLQ